LREASQLTHYHDQPGSDVPQPGLVKEAEELERLHGEVHPDSLTSMANLALMYCHQGLWKEAEELEVHVMKTNKCCMAKGIPTHSTA